MSNKEGLENLLRFGYGWIREGFRMSDGKLTRLADRLGVPPADQHQDVNAFLVQDINNGRFYDILDLVNALLDRLAVDGIKEGDDKM